MQRKEPNNLREAIGDEALQKELEDAALPSE